MLSKCLLSCLILTLGFNVYAKDKAADTDASLNNKIQWSTASEVNNFAYDVYRGNAKAGPFVRINKTPLAGAGTIDTPQSYTFIDADIAPNTVYFYYVESIAMDGVRERFTPVFASKPKSLAK